MTLKAIQCVTPAFTSGGFAFIINLKDKKFMEYTFDKRDENSTSGFTTIKADLERWAWGVVYKDGSELKQFDDIGKFHQFGEIQQENIDMFVMWKTDGTGKRIDMVCKEGVQIFHFYRNLILENGEIRKRVYVFGWKNKETGVCSYNYILPDDRLVTSDFDIENLLVFNL